jgi:hypothetical protein
MRCLILSLLFVPVAGMANPNISAGHTGSTIFIAVSNPGGPQLKCSYSLTVGYSEFGETQKSYTFEGRFRVNANAADERHVLTTNTSWDAGSMQVGSPTVSCANDLPPPPAKRSFPIAHLSTYTQSCGSCSQRGSILSCKSCRRTNGSRSKNPTIDLKSCGDTNGVYWICSKEGALNCRGEC